MLPGDFFIIEVRFDTATGLVNELKVYCMVNCKPSESFWASREDVLAVLKDGHRVEVVAPAGSGVEKLRPVRVVEVNGTAYLQVEGAPGAGDWLGMNSDHPGKPAVA